MVFRSLFVAVLASLACRTSLAGGPWQGLPSMNTARSGCAALLDLRGNIWAIGGTAGSTRLSSVETFDGTTWQAGPSLNEARHAMGAVSTGGFMYVIGGTGPGQTLLASVERLDLTSPSPAWSTAEVPSLPSARAFAGAAVDRLGRIWVVGGQDSSGTDLATVEIYDPCRPSLGWTAGPSLVLPRHSLGVVRAPDGRLYAIGGSLNGVHQSAIERLDPTEPAPAWASLGDIPVQPTSEQGTAVVGADGAIYIVGGWLPGCTGRTLRYLPVNGGWQELSSSLNTARSNIGLVLDNQSRIIAVGGDCVAPSDVVEGLDTSPCKADYNDDGFMDGIDYDDFMNDFEAGCP